jgi:hypothetical protein
MTALRFPESFPPTDRWARFFLGVRWIGPDLSFFKELKMQQARRSATDIDEWGGGLRQAVATAMSRVLANQLGWKSEVFLPQDAVAVAFHGPRFDFNDPDSAFEEIVEVLDRDFQIKVPDAFWASKSEANLGELVDVLLTHRAA